MSGTVRNASNLTIHLHDPRWKKALRPHGKTVREACAAALGRKKIALAIVLADDAFIRTLNRDFRGIGKATNVLAFPGEQSGDIILAYDTIAREAKEQRKTIKAHTQHMLVHGVLHLLGMDHQSRNEAEKMEALEIKILKKLMVRNPYLSP